ncbi:MAG: ribonuclease P protein component [Cyanobacteria bacterium J06626_4]
MPAKNAHKYRLVALPKPYRLTRTKEFSKVYRYGKQASTQNLAVRVLEIAEQSTSGCSRFGITISQKVSKRAVRRNRLKRQIRGGLQALIPRLKSNLWIVIILRSPAVHCDYWQFLRELEQLFLELEVFDGY